MCFLSSLLRIIAEVTSLDSICCRNSDRLKVMYQFLVLRINDLGYLNCINTLSSASQYSYSLLALPSFMIKLKMCVASLVLNINTSFCTSLLLFENMS